MRIHTLALVAASICVFIFNSTSFADTSSDAAEAFGRGDHQAARKILLDGDGGDKESKFILAFMLSNGLGGSRDEQEAVKWLHESAEDNFPPAQLELAKAYYIGSLGLTTDYNKSLHLAKQAANSIGNAMALLGLHYEKGQGTNKDISQAINWYTKAANKDDLFSQVQLGKIYIKNEKHKSYNKAHRWLAKAADRGDKTSQMLLGSLYTTKGFSLRNNIQAYKWLSLSKNDLPDKLKALTETSLRNVRKEMSQGDIAQAETLINEWEAKPGPILFMAPFNQHPQSP